MEGAVSLFCLFVVCLFVLFLAPQKYSSKYVEPENEAEVSDFIYVFVVVVVVFVVVVVYFIFLLLSQLGPNADIKKWEEEQMRIANVRFGAKDSKERNKVRDNSITNLFVCFVCLFCAQLKSCAVFLQ